MTEPRQAATQPVEVRRPLSLNLRLALAATAALLLFLAIAGLFLDQLFATTSEQARRERLETLIYALLADTDMDASGQLLLPKTGLTPRLSTPASGLYASMLGPNGQGLWRSDSASGLPALNTQLPPGQWRQQRLKQPGGELFVLAFGVNLESFESPGLQQEFTVSVAEDLAPYRRLLKRFRWNVAIGAGLLALLFGLLLTVLLRWSQRPLRQVAHDLQQIEAGDASQLHGPYPRELDGLAKAINGLLNNNSQQLQRYRNALGDLSHSLKTPLAVLRGGLDRQGELYGQTERMQQVVDYHLERAASAGGQLALQRIALAPIAERIAAALRKVHADAQVQIELHIDPALTLRADAGDLTELLGNLLDNACKYGRGKVRVQAAATKGGTQIDVEDNGPGLTPEQACALLKRGRRGDEAAPGHGLGLGLVTDLVELYIGELQFSQSSIGGLKVSLRLPS